MSYQFQDNMQGLTELLSYQFEGCEELGEQLDRFNGAVRTDILKDSKGSRLVKNPSKLLMLLKYFMQETGSQAGYGLAYKERNKVSFIPYVFEYDESHAEGLFYFDQKRPLSVQQIQAVEKITKETGLARSHIVANEIGLPAKDMANRINQSCSSDLISLDHYDSVNKKYQIAFHAA